MARRKKVQLRYGRTRPDTERRRLLFIILSRMPKDRSATVLDYLYVDSRRLGSHCLELGSGSTVSHRSEFRISEAAFCVRNRI